MMMLKRVSFILSFLLPLLSSAQDTAFSYHIGYRVIRLNDELIAAVWYPTDSAGKSFSYTNDIESIIADSAPVSRAGRFPLVVFSHGYGGCGTQSIFFTEALARKGYIVIAPDHHDAMCSIDGKGDFDPLEKGNLMNPEKWSDSTYMDRRNDILAVINYLLTDKEFSASIDSNKIGVAGHSLGGYTAMGFAGGWDSWKDKRIKAVLLFSPYLAPYEVKKRISSVDIPVMMQGAELDIFLTPPMRKKNGIYDQLGTTRYYVELKGGSHLEWSNLVCLGKKKIGDCYEARKNAKLINDYSLAFFDKHLKEYPRLPLLEQKSGLAKYKFSLKE
jgi:predicted dienelactone hydrolase